MDQYSEIRRINAASKLIGTGIPIFDSGISSINKEILSPQSKEDVHEGMPFWVKQRFLPGPGCIEDTIMPYSTTVSSYQVPHRRSTGPCTCLQG